jgi:hypothetical protein
VKLISNRLAFAGLLIFAAIAAACTEKLDNSSGCPILCPSPGGQIETVTIDVVSLDSTVSALVGQGTEDFLFLATRGDTLDSRAVIRFDSIPARYQATPGDTTTAEITEVDSAFLRLVVDTTDAKLPSSITLDLYDVDSSAPDSSVAAIAALFTSSRLVTSATFDSAALEDTINIAIPPEAILAHAGGRLRIGISARGPESVQFKMLALEGGAPTLLSFRVSPDTAVAKIVLAPFSSTPEDQPILAASLADYTLLVKGTGASPLDLLDVGGLPPKRVYMRFELPAFITDSVDVVRATLLLTQLPNTTIDPGDTVLIVPMVSLAGIAITDLSKASQITAVASTDTLRVVPGGSGLRSIEISNLVTLWRTQKPEDTPRAVVLVATEEGTSPLEARFYSSEAAPELRPRLRISYSPRRSTGLP